jgi:hypothetical protein
VSGTEAVVASDGQRQRAVDARRFFDRDGVRRHVEAGAAIGLRNLDSEQPQLRELRHYFCWKPLCFVPLAGPRLHPLPKELPQAVTKDGVMFTQLEIHKLQL